MKNPEVQQVRKSIEALAENLRKTYWETGGIVPVPWVEASHKSKNGWRTAARKMFDAAVIEEQEMQKK